MSEEKLSSIEDIRKQIGAERIITLPDSKARIKVRTLTVMDYIENGVKDIPNEFYKFMAALNPAIKVPPDEKLSDEETKETAEWYEKYLTVSISLGVVTPPMILKYDSEKMSTHLLFSEFSTNDQKFLMDSISGKTNEG